MIYLYMLCNIPIMYMTVWNNTDTYTHTHTYIYMCVRACVCVCVLLYENTIHELKIGYF